MKYASCILFLGFQLLFPFDSFADYEICLKNGRTLLVERYWEEKNGQVKAICREGVIGFNKDFILEIRSASPLIKTPRPPPPVQAPGPTGDSSPEKSKARGNAEKLRVKFLEEKRRIGGHINETGAAFREAKNRNDKEKAEARWQDLIRLHNELNRLRSDAIKSNNGYLPDWWEDSVESAN